MKKLLLCLCLLGTLRLLLTLCLLLPPVFIVPGVVHRARAQSFAFLLYGLGFVDDPFFPGSRPFLLIHV